MNVDLMRGLHAIGEDGLILGNWTDGSVARANVHHSTEGLFVVVE
jgi:hypothetical protein